MHVAQTHAAVFSKTKHWSKISVQYRYGNLWRAYCGVDLLTDLDANASINVLQTRTILSHIFVETTDSVSPTALMRATSSSHDCLSRRHGRQSASDNEPLLGFQNGGTVASVYHCYITISACNTLLYLLWNIANATTLHSRMVQCRNAAG